MKGCTVELLQLHHFSLLYLQSLPELFPHSLIALESTNGLALSIRVKWNVDG